MKKLFQIFFILFVSSLLLSTCKKYSQDNKKLHLRRPEKRMLGKWSLQSVQDYVKNSSSIGYSCGAEYISFGSPNVFDIGYLNSYYFTYKGIWELIDNKNKLKITEPNNNEHIFLILQLEKDHLKFKDDSLQYTFRNYCGP